MVRSRAMRVPGWWTGLRLMLLLAEVAAGALCAMVLDHRAQTSNVCEIGGSGCLGSTVFHTWLVWLAVAATVPVVLGAAGGWVGRSLAVFACGGVAASLAFGLTLGGLQANRATYDDSTRVVVEMFVFGGPLAALPGILSTGLVWAASRIALARLRASEDSLP